jgi:hypothetical protein
VRGAGAVGAHQDLALERLGIQLRERETQQRPGREEDPARASDGSHDRRSEAGQAISQIGRYPPSTWRSLEVQHRQLRRRLPRAHPHLRRPRPRNRTAQASQTLSVEPVDHPERRSVRGDIPDQVKLAAQRPEIRRQSPPSCEHHHQIAQHRSTTPGPCAEHHPRVGAERRAPLPSRRRGQYKPSLSLMTAQDVTVMPNGHVVLQAVSACAQSSLLDASVRMQLRTAVRRG